MKRIIINYAPKGTANGQVAIYCEYEQPLSVAVAILCINELRIGKNYILKCSYATSKYCSNFQKYSFCEAHMNQVDEHHHEGSSGMNENYEDE